ncbi:DUF4123 domain-containing protein [Halomonas elongata]|uniref:DUF4123 domain-containing protein n=1 Tax=Halomonas elongata TaxID=2746 RepID=UPI0023AF8CC7|nr:DUF4123 domain-containing protein [Halomonas elongata]
MSAWSVTRPPVPGDRKGERLFVLLDGVAMEPLERWLYETHPSPVYEPLYLDTPLAECRALSPCLIELEAGSPVLARFIEEQATREAGWLMTSGESLEVVADHLRGLLIVEHPWQGEQTLRVASPEVMRCLLEAEPAPTASSLLGPIERLWLPELHEQDLIWYHLESDRERLRDSLVGRFQLTEAHCASLSRIVWRRFRFELAEHLQAYFAKGPWLLTFDGADQAAGEVIELTATFGFHGRRAHFYLANILGAHGRSALEEETMPELARCLKVADGRPSMERLKSAVALAQDRLNKETSA